MAFIGQTITNKATGTSNIHGHLPTEPMANTPGLIEAGTRNEEQNNPWDPQDHAESWITQFRRTKSEQNRCQQQRSENADQLVTNARHDCPKRPNKILCGMICRRNMAEPKPGGYILWRVGNQRKKEQRAGKKQNEGEHFVPSADSFCAAHRV